MDPKDVLNAMIKFAEELNGHDLAKMATNDQYIRIGGTGFRSVSLNNLTPLSGYADKPSGKLDKILNEFETRKPNPMDPVVREKKEERRLQRHIIKSSLMSERKMIEALGLVGSPYDELLFATDEVALADVRCDLLAVGRIKNEYYPVIIELKSTRAKTELVQQLDAFAKKIINYGDEFNKLLSSLTGNLDVKINTQAPCKIIIWPVADSESKVGGKGWKSSANAQKTRDELEKNGISVIEYDEFDKDGSMPKFYQTWANHK